MTSLRPILGLSFAHLVTDLYTPVIPAILPLLILQNGFSYVMAGLFITVFQLTSSFVQPLTGWLYDTRGTAVNVSVSILLSAVCISSIGLLSDYRAILLCAALGGLGHALFHPAALGTVSKLVEDQSRGRLTSYFVVGGNFGFAVGPVVAGALVGLFGLQGICLLVIPGLITAAALRLFLPQPTWTPRDETGAGSVLKSSSVRSAIVLVVAGSAFRSWAIFGSIAFLPTLLIARDMTLIAANTLVSLMLLAGVFGQLFGGTVSDRYGRKEYTLFGLVASAPFFLIFLQSSGLISYIALLLFGFFLWSTFSVTLAMAHELVPGNSGLISGLMLGFAVGTGGAGVAVTGLLADTLGLEQGFTLLILPVAAAFLIFLLAPYPLRLLRNRNYQKS
ncbi:MAG: MFS transporter [Methanoculleus sp. SDB]|nr:MAG: MFS transporter [Methanoculleus sp. SDB]